MIVNVTVPTSWQELTQKQLYYAYFLLSSEQYSEDQIKGLCIIRWGKLEGMLQSIRPEQLAGFLPMMDWLMSIPEYPVRLDEIQGHAALYRPDLQGLPFEQYLVLENNYQGYVHTKRIDCLNAMASVLYGAQMQLTAPEAYSVFVWFASIKQRFASLFSNFFVPSPMSENTGDIGTALRKAMNTQIRALTKGDITKEKEILALDVYRALTELDAQAEEYNELKKQIKK